MNALVCSVISTLDAWTIIDEFGPASLNLISAHYTLFDLNIVINGRRIVTYSRILSGIQQCTLQLLSVVCRL
jgi:hypothetical protein